VLLGTGCQRCNGGTDQPATVDAGAKTSAALTPEQSKQVLARVGDQVVTLGDFAAALENMDQFDRLRYQSPERRQELLNEMINVMLLAKEAEEKGYDKDTATQQELRSILRDAVLAEVRKNSPTPDKVPEADVREYYQSHRADFRDPERRRVSLIVTKDDAQAQEVFTLAKAAKSPSEWGDLVRQKSQDPQAKANVPIDLAGDFGIVSPPGDPRGENNRVPAEVRAALFAIKEPGTVFERPVRAKDKVYLVRLTQVLAPHERSYEEAERTIRVKLAQDKARAKEDELVAELRKKYPVQVDQGALSKVRVELPDAGAPDAARP